MIRPAFPTDAPEMAAIQNEIIGIGGTTAYQEERSVEAVRRYVDGVRAVCCHVAEMDGRVIGFQALGLHPGLPVGWGDVGTFVQAGLQARGVGAALFAATRTAARALGIRVLNATIRADNAPGLAYYARLRFVDYDHDPDFRLQDGMRVGRVHRRFDL